MRKTSGMRGQRGGQGNGQQRDKKERLPKTQPSKQGAKSATRPNTNLTKGLANLRVTALKEPVPGTSMSIPRPPPVPAKLLNTGSMMVFDTQEDTAERMSPIGPVSYGPLTWINPDTVTPTGSVYFVSLSSKVAILGGSGGSLKDGTLLWRGHLGEIIPKEYLEAPKILVKAVKCSEKSRKIPESPPPPARPSPLQNHIVRCIAAARRIKRSVCQFCNTCKSQCCQEHEPDEISSDPLDAQEETASELLRIDLKTNFEAVMQVVKRLGYTNTTTTYVVCTPIKGFLYELKMESQYDDHLPKVSMDLHNKYGLCVIRDDSDDQLQDSDVSPVRREKNLRKHMTRLNILPVPHNTPVGSSASSISEYAQVKATSGSSTTISSSNLPSSYAVPLTINAEVYEPERQSVQERRRYSRASLPTEWSLCVQSKSVQTSPRTEKPIKQFRERSTQTSTSPDYIRILKASDRIRQQSCSRERRSVPPRVSTERDTRSVSSRHSTSTDLARPLLKPNKPISRSQPNLKDTKIAIASCARPTSTSSSSHESPLRDVLHKEIRRKSNPVSCDKSKSRDLQGSTAGTSKSRGEEQKKRPIIEKKVNTDKKSIGQAKIIGQAKSSSGSSTSISLSNLPSSYEVPLTTSSELYGPQPGQAKASSGSSTSISSSNLPSSYAVPLTTSSEVYGPECQPVQERRRYSRASLPTESSLCVQSKSIQTSPRAEEAIKQFRERSTQTSTSPDYIRILKASDRIRQQSRSRERRSVSPRVSTERDTRSVSSRPSHSTSTDLARPLLKPNKPRSRSQHNLKDTKIATRPTSTSSSSHESPLRDVLHKEIRRTQHQDRPLLTLLSGTSTQSTTLDGLEVSVKDSPMNYEEKPPPGDKDVFDF